MYEVQPMNIQVYFIIQVINICYEYYLIAVLLYMALCSSANAIEILSP